MFLLQRQNFLGDRSLLGSTLFRPFVWIIRKDRNALKSLGVGKEKCFSLPPPSSQNSLPQKKITLHSTGVIVLARRKFAVDTPKFCCCFYVWRVKDVENQRTVVPQFGEFYPPSCSFVR